MQDMFGWFATKKVARQVPTEVNLQESDWTQSKSHLFLLSRFRLGDDPANYPDNSHWTALLGELPRAAIGRMTDAGVLVPANVEQKIDRLFQVPDLKRLLTARGLKASGKKAELIGRLLLVDREWMEGETQDTHLLSCSPVGLEMAKKHLALCAQDRTTAERQVIAALGARDFRATRAIVGAFEARQVFPHGVDLNGSAPGNATRPYLLEYIYSRTPALLASLSSERLEHLRLGAALMHLWGTHENKNEGALTPPELPKRCGFTGPLTVLVWSSDTAESASPHHHADPTIWTPNHFAILRSGTGTTESSSRTRR